MAWNVRSADACTDMKIPPAEVLKPHTKKNCHFINSISEFVFIFELNRSLNCALNRMKTWQIFHNKQHTHSFSNQIKSKVANSFIRNPNVKRKSFESISNVHIENICQPRKRGIERTFKLTPNCWSNKSFPQNMILSYCPDSDSIAIAYFVEIIAFWIPCGCICYGSSYLVTMFQFTYTSRLLCACSLQRYLANFDKSQDAHNRITMYQLLS